MKRHAWCAAAMVMGAVVGMAGVLCGAAWAAPPPKEEGGPVDAFAKLTRGTTKACFVMKMEGDGRRVKIAGEMKFWLDTARGLYRVQITATTTGTRAGGPGQETGEAGMLFAPEGSVMWEKTNGKAKVGTPTRHVEEKTVPGKCVLLGDMGPMTLFVDAAFGYEHLASEAILKPATAPQEDKFRWFEVEPNPKVKDSKLAGVLRKDGGGEKVLIGFSPESGWPVKMVFRSNDLAATLEVTKVDFKPDLESVFDLPAEVKDKLKGKEGDEVEGKDAGE